MKQKSAAFGGAPRARALRARALGYFCCFHFLIDFWLIFCDHFWLIFPRLGCALGVLTFLGKAVKGIAAVPEAPLHG